MKYFITVCVVIFAFSLNSFSQEKNTTHKVGKGETINSIAQKYNVTPYDIYKLNPDAQSGLKPNSILLIPKKGNVPAVKGNLIAKTHKVEPKETLFGIEKKYGVSDEALKKANPELEKLGLQIGQTLVIPTNSSSRTVALTPEKNVYHVVLPKETKYSIAKEYGITIEELERKNPEIIPSLPIGYQLTIKGAAPKTDKVAVDDLKIETPKPIVTKAVPAINHIEYVVKPKETLYSLSRMAGLSQEELMKLNPALANGVEVGMILKMPSTALIPQEVQTKKEYISLSKNTNDRKKLVLLLPFNLSKVEGDTINSTTMRLKKDKFLNMTLDFYSGALMAIDSAKSIGINVDVKIFDSQETKNTSNVAIINNENNLETADAIIGPFYQSNVEKIAELLGKYNVPVISPLSKDIGISFPNLYQTIPTNEALKTAMFDFMRSKAGNIIAVVDKKKESVIQYIRDKQKDVQFAALQSNGSLSAESLKSLFVKNKTNYVVMETGNTGMIKSTMAAMMSATTDYKVQLVILEPNETLDTDEINFENLTKLNLMYPSIARENKSPEALIFEKEFRIDNKIFPSTFATRGFDVTFDTLMRLSQNKSYLETVDSIATEQVNNKFEYYKKEDGGYTNKGIYILYYDTDLTIKEAN